MSDPNEPRLMKPQREEKHDYDDSTGDAGRDGYSCLARRVPRGRAGADSEYGPFSAYGGSDDINPQVGSRDYNRGPRFSEDY